MLMGRCATSWLLCFVLLPAAVFAAEGDVAGSADYPAIGRFEGSVILSYDVRDFDEYTLFTGPVKNNQPESAVTLEGKVYRLSYRHEPGPSVLEVAKNFEIKLQEKGFDILFKCQAKACGRGEFGYATETLPVPRMVVDMSKYRYIAARMSDEAGTVHASVLVSTNNRKIYIQVFVVESEAMALRMVDAEQMAASISDTGRVVLYGIHFDTDKTDIKPESRPTLDQIAALLTASPGLRLIVVGHSDNQGTLDYNMDLSRRRAQAVVGDLVASYGVAGARLLSAGVGFLAPVAPNTTPDGRAQNRRVELIEQ